MDESYPHQTYVNVLHSQNSQQWEDSQFISYGFIKSSHLST